MEQAKNEKYTINKGKHGGFKIKIKENTSKIMIYNYIDLASKYILKANKLIGIKNTKN